jgi:hypothetical protein
MGIKLNLVGRCQPEYTDDNYQLRLVREANVLIVIKPPPRGSLNKKNTLCAFFPCAVNAHVVYWYVDKGAVNKNYN